MWKFIRRPVQISSLTVLFLTCGWLFGDWMALGVGVGIIGCTLAGGLN